ncbi:hypothetical protein Acr_09g0001190 [Actinidia rufa]|uniref:Reverse transcriptase zinc-binding domain-containing protein n=1 Tax=Actinidia rufa TaxID=165716 RepID=A0A7J0F511_9ERIC|nr:hypothetical protein Acr_09g0001190 [Actinidia rufa]
MTVKLDDWKWQVNCSSRVPERAITSLVRLQLDACLDALTIVSVWGLSEKNSQCKLSSVPCNGTHQLGWGTHMTAVGDTPAHGTAWRGPPWFGTALMVGHTKETCKSKSLPSKKTVVQVAESTVQVPKEDAVQLTGMGGNSGAIVVQLAETTMQRPKEATVQLSGVGGKSGALSTKEWVMKMAIHPIDNTISQPQSNNPETEANNNIVPSKNLAGTSESPVTEEDIATPTDPCHGDTGPDINRDPNPEILEISLDPVTAPNPKQPPDQTPKQIGGEIYIQQANQITSGELKSKLHQLSKSQGSTAHGNLKKGHVSVPRRQGNAALAKPPDKASSSSIIPPLLEKDGERRKKKDKVNQGKGLNMPLKQGEVRNHLRRKKVAIMGIMETKLNHHTLEGIARTKFVGWRVANNFSHHPNGRILILWKEELVRLDIIETTDQNSWILLGDFNNVLNNDERINGQPVTMYETREFKDCCYDLGLSDLRSSGMFHTWSNNKIWCKLDRAMVNTAWTQKGLSGQAHFDTPGIHSDHSPCTISVMGENDRGPNPFKFFNMWTRHEDFQNIVSNTWGMHVVGSAMFRLCKKLKSLKEPLKSLNKHHFSHISERVKAAEVELAHAQQQLHDNTIDTLLQSRVLELRSRALKLAEAEASYCSQLAKAKYLKNCDRGSKFFHDLIKSRQTKSIISSITLGNGSRSNSSKQISDAFVQFYESLLGTKEDCSGLNSEIVSSGRRLNPSQADNLICPFLLSAGINPTDTEIIERTTGFNQGIFPFKYLGIPVAASRLSIAQFSPFIDKISGYISAWAGASLSYAGRTELIKSVLQGVECFWLSILPIPVGAKKDSLWVQWVHQIYLNRRSFWEYKNRHEDSPLLKQVVTLRDELIEAEGSLENAVQRLNQWAPNGEFQSKLAYEFFRPKGATVTWPKLVWHNSITPKHSFILWLGLKDRLLTRDKLRDFIEDQSCPLCSFEAESIDHLFFYCQVGNQIWTEIKSWLGISRAMTTLKSAVKWMIKEARGTSLPAKIKKISLACTIYHIWVARNKRIFEGKTDHTKAIIRRIQIHVYRSIYILFPDFRPEIL